MPGDGGNDDDGASAAGAHGIEHRLDAVYRAHRIGLERQPEVIRCGLLEGTGKHDSGVAYQDAGVAESPLRELHRIAPVIAAGDIEVHVPRGRPEALRNAAAEVVADIPDDHTRAGGRQAASGRLANAASAASHDRDLSAQ